MRSSSCCCASAAARAAGARALCRVHELAVQAPVGIARDAPAGGLGRASVIFQRRSAAELRMYSWPPRTRTTGMLRRDPVEIVAQRQALFVELRFVPVAVRDDHVARRRRLHARRSAA